VCALPVKNPNGLLSVSNLNFRVRITLICSPWLFLEETALKLEDYGWNSYFKNQSENHQSKNLIPARVIFCSRGAYRLASDSGDLWAEIAGSLRHKASGVEGLPVCGDWVLVDNPLQSERTVIRVVLPRKTLFSRQQAGTAPGQQCLAANVDTVGLVCGLDSDFNLRRIERYLVIAWESGARPVIVLNKADICVDLPTRLEAVRSLSPGVSVLGVSAENGSGIEDLLACIGSGQTLALLGSSGVGKSSIVNRLLGKSVQDVRETDADTGRGLHTTVSRQLFLLPSGGLIMDTPGMRELQAWSVDSGIDTVFEDINSLAEGCRYRNCTHQSEPGCQVCAAIDRGELDAGRVSNYFKLSKEARYIELKNGHSSSWVERERWKKVAKAGRKIIPKDRRWE
jgi:ribosome biogenesis GTPase / thiamine phosphate phosphatase